MPNTEAEFALMTMFHHSSLRGGICQGCFFSFFFSNFLVEMVKETVLSSCANSEMDIWLTLVTV